MRDLRRLPTAHLPVHLESAIRPGTLAELAAAAGVPVPAATAPYRGFAAFAAVNGAVRDCLRRPADFARIAREFCADQAAAGTRYVEVTFTAAGHGERLGDPGMPLSAVLDGLAEGQDEHDVTVRLLLDHPRRRSVERFAQTLTLARRHAVDGVVGIGFAGEEGHPLSPFRDVLAAAVDAGVRLVHHAGEGAGRPASGTRWTSAGRSGSGTASAASRTTTWWPSCASVGCRWRSARRPTSVWGWCPRWPSTRCRRCGPPGW